MPECEEFYRRRDARTSEYVAGLPFNRLPVHVTIGAQCGASPPGQVVLLSLANQLSRVHRRISFDVGVPSARLQIANPFARATLGDTLLTTVKQIDPCGDFRIGPRPSQPVVTVGIGAGISDQCDWYLGAAGANAVLAKSAVAFSETKGTLRGAALASCLGAAAVFRSILGLESVSRTVSAWNYAEGCDASPGPQSLESVNVGRVLMVGAGAVAAALIYWLYVFGVGGEWTIIDKDTVILHNTNRGLLFTAEDAGWPDKAGQPKGERMADLVPGSRFERQWYHDSTLAQETYDVVLGLANEYEVRHRVACRNNTITLHATTGRNWLSQMHRHIVGLDDCIWCRTGEASTPNLQCSSGEVKSPAGVTTDAALPFLSAASGLMLAIALQRLQHGELADLDRNDWRWDFGSTHKMVSSSFRKCRAECSRIVPAEVRRKMNMGECWRHLDQAPF